MVLKPQDVAVVLKICSHSPPRLPYAQLSKELSMSVSEVHAAVKRLQKARLMHFPVFGERPNFTALEEFLVHGLKYAFPPERGTLTRGVPTSYAADPLCKKIVQGTEPVPVW